MSSGASGPEETRPYETGAPVPAPMPAMPRQVGAGIALLAGSLVPVWLLDLPDGSLQARIRFWTTVFVGVALFGVSRRMTLFRWLLLALLGTGVAVTAWNFVQLGTIRPRALVITAAQVIALALFFAPAANAWFRTPAARG